MGPLSRGYGTCTYNNIISISLSFPGSGEEAAPDVWREGRRGRGTQTRHRRLENNVQITGIKNLYSALIL